MYCVHVCAENHKRTLSHWFICSTLKQTRCSFVQVRFKCLTMALFWIVHKWVKQKEMHDNTWHSQLFVHVCVCVCVLTERLPCVYWSTTTSGFLGITFRGSKEVITRWSLQMRSDGGSKGTRACLKNQHMSNHKCIIYIAITCQSSVDQYTQITLVVLVNWRRFSANAWVIGCLLSNKVLKWAAKSCRVSQYW